MKAPYDQSYFANQSAGYQFNKERRDIFSYHLKQILKRKRARRILDIGCGFGYFLGLCDEKGIKTYGLEISEYAISQAKKFTKAKIRSNFSFFEGKTFDAITAFDVLEHLEDDQGMLKFIYQRLKKRGLFYATTPNAAFVLRKFFKDKDQTHINVWDQQYWLLNLRNIGFSRVKIKHIFSFGFPPTPSLREKVKPSIIKPVFLPIKKLGQELLLIAQK